MAKGIAPRDYCIRFEYKFNWVIADGVVSY